MTAQSKIERSEMTTERIAELERKNVEIKKLVDNWEAWAFSTVRDERNGDLCDFIEKLKAVLASHRKEDKAL